MGINTVNIINEYSVSQNFPNPAKGLTAFDLTISTASMVNLEISNMMGQKEMEIDKGLLSSGRHKITLDATRLAPGIYFYTVKINGASITRKMVVG